jgi:hypothetical protein
MIIKRLAQVVSITGLAALMMVGSASAAGITYTTSGAGGAWIANDPVTGELTLKDTSGQTATIVFTPNSASNTGIPSNIDLGDFDLTCATCTTLAGGQGAFFAAFTFDLIVTDSTDGATGEFVGTSNSGTVYSDSSTIDIIWSPLTLGPNTVNAMTGNFGATSFTITSPTQIVGANSGTPAGDTSVQAFVSGATPEPATLPLIGGGLMALGFLGRKKLLRAKTISV